MIGELEITPRYLCGQPVERSTPVGAARGVASGACRWSRRDDDQFRALLERSTQDLAGLRIFDPEFPDRAVVAAGAPWFMTLFGRDSLITSWMTMLVDPDLALGTLQTLARFQGTEVDPRTEEEPGRILHEMRFGETASLALGGGRIYYGTVDATPLFVMLVGELSRWGNRRDEVDALLPAADRGARVDHRLRRQRRRRLRRVPAHDRPRPAEPGLEGLLGLDALRRRLARRDADRAVRGAGLRVRRARSRAAHCATEAGDHALAAIAAARAPTS